MPAERREGKKEEQVQAAGAGCDNRLDFAAGKLVFLN